MPRRRFGARPRRRPSDGEDIEVLEIAFADALEMIKTGAIIDGKTIMLLQYAQLEGLFKAS